MRQWTLTYDAKPWNPVNPEWDRVFGHRVAQIGECLEFTGCRDPVGYGRVRYGGKVFVASRLALILATGPRESRILACHTCDNPPCVNVEHLFWGTHDVNNKDSVAKGRSAKGSRQSQSKLTEADVIRIRQMKADGVDVKSIASVYSIHPMHVNRIIRRDQWKHV